MGGRHRRIRATLLLKYIDEKKRKSTNTRGVVRKRGSGKNQYT